MKHSYSGAVRDFALAFDGAREEFSFGDDHPLFKAANGKMFAIASEDAASTNVSLKLTPGEAEEALTLPFVRPAPYLGRYHWVMASISNDAELEMTLAWIRRSYELVTTRPARKRQ